MDIGWSDGLPSYKHISCYEHSFNAQPSPIPVQCQSNSDRFEHFCSVLCGRVLARHLSSSAGELLASIKLTSWRRTGVLIKHIQLSQREWLECCNINGRYYGESGSYYAVNFYLSGNFYLIRVTIGLNCRYRNYFGHKPLRGILHSWLFLAGTFTISNDELLSQQSHISHILNNIQIFESCPSVSPA